MPEVNRVEEEMPVQPGMYKPGTEPQKPTPPERPAWLPQKYKDGEQLAKGYTEAQRELAAAKAELAALKQKPAGTPPAPAGESKPGEQPPAGTPPAPSTLAPLTADHFARYAAEVNTAGELSPSSYAELAAHGFSRDMADAFIAGQGAIQNSVVREAHEIVGGQENYDAMRAWAAENVGPDEAKVIDAAFNSRDKAQILWAVKALHAQWQAATSQEPSTLVSGNPQGSPGVMPFRNQNEMTAAIRHPLYRQDEGYRQAVAARVAVSNF